jgi:peptidylprolyl isomerase
MKKTQLILLIAIMLLAACENRTGSKNAEVTTDSGLRYTIIQHGKGEPVKTGDKVLIHETVGYTRGTRLFTTKDLGSPIQVVVGEKQVINGVDEGLVGMKTGEIRRLVIPPELSRRKEYPPFLSPDSTLVYDIELISINN